MKAVGIYRTNDEWARVDYGAFAQDVTRVIYNARAYQPVFETLPAEADWKRARALENRTWLHRVEERE